MVGKIYTRFIDKLEVKIPWYLLEVAQDESPILRGLSIFFDENGKMRIRGACGWQDKDGEEHECWGITSEEIEYMEQLLEFVDKCCLCTNISVIMVNVLNAPGFPKLPLALLPTCNCFKHHHITRIWTKLMEMWDKVLFPVFGCRPIAFSSDGDGRRVANFEYICTMQSNTAARVTGGHARWCIDSPLVRYGGWVRVIDKDK